jgi:hypothetical protein
MLSSYAGDSAGDSLLKIISEVLQRWHSIQLGGDALSFPGDSKYPLLEKLVIASFLTGLPILRDAPLLHDVFISTYAIKINLPVHQLTKFGTLETDIEACLELLRHASNFVDAHLRISPYDPSALPNTIFSALKTLALGFEHSVVGQLVDISPFLSFVSQSSFQLNTLSLSCIPATTEALFECLKATPSVIHLKLQISPRISDVNPVFTEFTNHHDLQAEVLRYRPCSLVTDGRRIPCGRYARLQSFRFHSIYDHDLGKSLQPYIKAHPVYSELEALGTELETTSFAPFMNLA